MKDKECSPEHETRFFFFGAVSPFVFVIMTPQNKKTKTKHIENVREKRISKRARKTRRKVMVRRHRFWESSFCRLSTPEDLLVALLKFPHFFFSTLFRITKQLKRAPVLLRLSVSVLLPLWLYSRSRKIYNTTIGLYYIVVVVVSCIVYVCIEYTYCYTTTLCAVVSSLSSSLTEGSSSSEMLLFNFSDV